MADGDAVLQDVVVCDYIADTGRVYSHRVKSFYQTQAALGWDLLSSSDFDTFPRGLKPRVWLVQKATDHSQRARIVVATNADYIAGNIDATTVKVIYRGYELTMTLYGKEGERRRGKTTDIGVQATLPA